MSPTTHHIVVIEAIHCPIPEFNLPEPHTRAIHRWTEPSELPSRVKDATILITTTIRLNAETLSPSITPNLRLIVIMATGTDCVDIAAATARNIPVCNCPGSNIDSVSEHAIGLYFATRRKFVELHNATAAVPTDPALDTEWKTNGSLLSRVRASDGKAPLLCADETVCVVGYGALGKRIETLARALGMEVIIAERKGGGIVDEKALLGALKRGVIAGAATDVYAVEPAGRGDSPLLSEEAKGLNLVLTPHLAWYSEKTLRNLQATVKNTVEKWCVGETINQVG
ncbi:uncharacterized protein N7515_009703 [Penicillium bovifimosum]|uniref:Glycerate dehydrogenase n=1 Tax=Penicillium bovifimosum TaxID=126998 RepID=A0A9W9GH22_9EURO|nr:uncharacterized protein N7515_009703 [Penicillium bovifimosum]KAJ5120315.1 hypothetical protein N7515_009703 [Penicillium bovifimosum]